MSPIRKDCVSISVCVKEEDKEKMETKEMMMKKEKKTNQENKEVTKFFLGNETATISCSVPEFNETTDIS